MRVTNENDNESESENEGTNPLPPSQPPFPSFSLSLPPLSPHSTDAHNYYKIFKSIDAEDNFHSRHLRAKLSEISNLWDSFKPSQGRGFGGWLVGFYEEVKRVVVEFVQVGV